MSHSVVPFWTLTSSEPDGLPQLPSEGGLTPQRLDELRSALAAFSAAPLVTLEAHPLREPVDTRRAMPLNSLSPLSQELSRLISSTPAPAAAASAVDTGEVLYRMVVPAKAALQMSSGALAPMRSSTVSGGVLSGLVDQSTRKLASSAAFVPVTRSGGVAAAGGGAAAAGGAAVGGAAGAVAAVTVAAPLILAAVAVAASAQAEAQRQRSLDNITTLLEQLHDANLQAKRDELDGCRDALDSATALLLDGGAVGSMQGMDSAAGTINTAVSTVTRLLGDWEKKLAGLQRAGKVDLQEIEKEFPGLARRGGQFFAELEMATLTLALKRRLVVLQAVEASQKDEGNTFERFTQKLHGDQKRVDALEERLRDLLVDISTLKISPPKKLRNTMLQRKQVELILDSVDDLRALGADLRDHSPSDVVVEIIRHADGNLHVLPPSAA